MKTTTIWAGILIVLMLAGLASAQSAPNPVLVHGLVTDNQVAVDGANIDATCQANGETAMTTTDSGGYYEVILNDCPSDSKIKVVATKGQLSGENTGTSDYDGELQLSLSLIDVDIVAAPEVVSLIAAIGALAPGAAYVMSRKRNN